MTSQEDKPTIAQAAHEVAQAIHLGSADKDAKVEQLSLCVRRDSAKLYQAVIESCSAPRNR